MPKAKAFIAKQGKTATAKSIEALESLLPAPEQQPGDTIDRDKAFQTYAAFNGDVARTAHALNVEPLVLLKMVDEGQWSIRLRSIFELRKTGKPADVERGISRTINFVQAHRLRMYLDRVVAWLYNMNDEEMIDFCVKPVLDKEGNSVGKMIVLKPLAELATALEKVHMMCYYSMADSPSERNKRGIDDNKELSLVDMHAAMAQQMAEIHEDDSPRAKELDAELKKANPDPSNPLAPPAS